MCGIAGIINFNQRPVVRKDLEKMIKLVKYRGPDDEGYFINKNVGLGHCRLSIIDLSKAGHQPMSNEDDTLWLVYNGEIYNYLELREELKSKGHQFKSGKIKTVAWPATSLSGNLVAATLESMAASYWSGPSIFRSGLRFLAS